MSGGCVTLILLAIIALFLWLAREYTRAHPLDLTPRLPQVEKYLLPDGMKLEADKAELFFDEGPVIRVSGLGLRGKNGELGVYVEQAAIQLATSQLLLLSVAPKVIEASGVTLRLVRKPDGISVAGLTVQQTSGTGGVVEWLNSIGWDRLWGRIKTVKIANLNLLLRDDVQHAEWVLERGNMVMSRYPDEGEKGTLTAIIRRLYGDVKQVHEIDNVPVLISFAHKPSADGMEIRGRLDRANAQMVTDYFPPQFKDIVQAQGQVEVGTRLMEENRFALPWVTMRLTDVKVQPPEGYSAALEFPKMTVTASYAPLAEGVSDSDVLSILDMQLTTPRGANFTISGTVTGVQSDPFINLNMTSPNGELQGVFDLFPDEVRGFSKALAWLRPNIQAGTYTGFTAHYAGRPSAFPGCGDACGTLDIDAQLQNGVVRYLKEMSPVKVYAGTFKWRGQVLEVVAPNAKIQGQDADDVHVTMSDIFAVSPTLLHVKANLKGDVSEVLAELGKLPETHGKIPQGIRGTHASQLDILVPMPRGVEPTFATSTVLVTSSLAGLNVSGLSELRELDFAAPKATVTLAADKTLRVIGDGTFGAYPMKADWSQNIGPGTRPMMKLSAQGTVGGEWLSVQAPSSFVSLTGPVGVAVSVQEDKTGKWLFAAKADATKSVLKMPDANFTKPKGDKLAVDASGSYAPSGTLVVKSLDVQGNKVSVNGAVTWNPDSLAGSLVNLSSMKLGDTDVTVDMANGKAVIRGTRLDLRGYDLFGGDSDKPASSQPDNLLLKVNVNEVLTEKGKLNSLVATAKATKGKWDLQNASALVDGSYKVSVLSIPYKNQIGRKKLLMDVQNLGSTLNSLGIYDKLEHGKMTGEITYDTLDTGVGVIKIIDFELKNPPFLVQLLSLLSLEQLLSGSGSTRFKNALVPVRVDHGVWYLKNASFEGPSMSLRLDGSYDTTSKQLDFDGKMAPAIPLNRLVSQIPLLGTLLAGSQDGVVVADFKLKGSADKPQINVRPLSVITPGLLKDFWRGITK